MTSTADDRARPGTGVDSLMVPRAEPSREGSPPDDHALARILETATTVPDHGGLRPWRFAVITGAGKERFADALVAGLHLERGDDLPEAMVTKMRGKAFAAPCTVALIASPDPESNVPVWEQVASASCTGYAMVLAATSLGFGAVWKSAAVVDTQPVRSLFGLAQDERLLGWVNLGTASDRGRRRAVPERADLSRLVTVIDIDDRPYQAVPTD
jgi:nitroreductase